MDLESKCTRSRGLRGRARASCQGRRRDFGPRRTRPPDMVFAIEARRISPGLGGVRIEDDVLVTGDGVEVLTDATTELIET